MNILKHRKDIERSNALMTTREGASAYLDKLSAALEVLLDFDAKSVDDIQGFKESLEKTGTPVCLATTPDGYQGLFGIDGRLIASNILPSPVSAKIGEPTADSECIVVLKDDVQYPHSFTFIPGDIVSMSPVKYTLVEDMGSKVRLKRVYE